MTQEKLEKYLKNYLDVIINPRFRKIYGDDNLEITLDNIKESETMPGVYRVFLGVNPEPSINLLYIQLTEDIYTFFDMLGFENLPVIFWSDDDAYVRPM
jgi:hypothetical protein